MSFTVSVEQAMSRGVVLPNPIIISGPKEKMTQEGIDRVLRATADYYDTQANQRKAFDTMFEKTVGTIAPDNEYQIAANKAYAVFEMALETLMNTYKQTGLKAS